MLIETTRYETGDPVLVNTNHVVLAQPAKDVSNVTTLYLERSVLLVAISYEDYKDLLRRGKPLWLNEIVTLHPEKLGDVDRGS